MSTKATLFYNSASGAHIYLDMTSDTVFVEHHLPGVSVVVELMDYDDWVENRFPTPYNVPYWKRVIESDVVKKRLHFRGVDDLEYAIGGHGRVMIYDKCGHYVWLDEVDGV